MSAIADVADDFCETDDANFNRAAGLFFDALTKRLEAGGDAQVVDFFAGAWIDFKELRADDRAGEIVRDQLAELAGLQDIFTDLSEIGRARGEVGRDDVSSRETVLDDFDVADVGREE